METNFKLVLENVFFAGELAVQAEELGFLLCERLRGGEGRLADQPRRGGRGGAYADIDLVALEGIHDGGAEGGDGSWSWRW